MRKAIIVAAMGLLACTSRAQTTYPFSWSGHQKAGPEYGTRLKFTAISVVTQVNITSATLENGCNSDLVYGYTPNSGPALQVGEFVQSNVLYFQAASSIAPVIALGTDANGNPTYTVDHTGCTSIANAPAGSIGLAGPSFTPTLTFPNKTACDPVQSSITFTLVQPDGSFSQESAAAGTVSCGLTYDIYTHSMSASGTFSGTLSTGQAYTATFSLTGYEATGSGRDPQSALYAQSAQWSLTY